MSKFKFSRKTNNIIKIVVCFLAGALFVGALGVISPFGEKDLNKDNLISVDNYIVEDEKTAIGVDIEVDEDTGVIKLSGKADSDYTVNVTQVELEAGTYTISGYDDSSKGRCYLSVLYDVDQIAMSGTKTATFTLEETQTVTVQIVIREDAVFNIFTASTFEPCLVLGKTEGSLFDK